MPISRAELQLRFPAASLLNISHQKDCIVLLDLINEPFYRDDRTVRHTAVQEAVHEFRLPFEQAGKLVSKIMMCHDASHELRTPRRDPHGSIKKRRRNNQMVPQSPDPEAEHRIIDEDEGEDGLAEDPAGPPQTPHNTRWAPILSVASTHTEAVRFHDVCCGVSRINFNEQEESRTTVQRERAERAESALRQEELDHANSKARHAELIRSIRSHANSMMTILSDASH